MKKETSRTHRSATVKNAVLIHLSADLVAILLSTFVILILILLPSINHSVFRLVLGSLIVIFSPGYALTAALFPKKGELSSIERITLAFGLSIAIVPLLAFVLGYSVGITLEPIVGVLTLFILTCSIAGILRRSTLALDARFTVEWNGLHRVMQLFPKGQRPRDRMMGALVVASLLFSTSVVAYAVITPNPGDRFTEFYILNSNGTAGGYPKQFSLANRTPIIVGLVNHEGSAVTYDLVITQNGTQPSTLYSEQLTLNDSSQLEKTIYLKPVQAGNNVEFKFQLFKSGDHSAPYRETHLFANVTR